MRFAPTVASADWSIPKIAWAKSSAMRGLMAMLIVALAVLLANGWLKRAKRPSARPRRLR